MPRPQWSKNRLVLKRWVAIVSKADRSPSGGMWRWSLYCRPEGSLVESKHLHSIGRASRRGLARDIVEAIITKLQPGWRRSG